MRQNRDPGFEFHDEEIEDPIRRMREPPGALGDIVRRMKRRAALKQHGQLADDGRHNTA